MPKQKKPPVLVGLCDCAHCGSEQSLMKDSGGKHYINCKSCQTFSSFQSLQAREHILGKIKKPAAQQPEQQVQQLPVEAQTVEIKQKKPQEKSWFAIIGGAK